MGSATNEPTILSRLDRLDIMMGYLEEIKGSRANRGSCTSTTSSGTATSGDGGNSSVNSSPKSVERQSRPIGDVVVETKSKGSLIDRVDHIEIRLVKLGLQLEKEIENERRKEEDGSTEKKTHKKGLKQLVKSCVKGDLKTKD